MQALKRIMIKVPTQVKVLKMDDSVNMVIFSRFAVDGDWSFGDSSVVSFGCGSCYWKCISQKQVLNKH